MTEPPHRDVVVLVRLGELSSIPYSQKAGSETGVDSQGLKTRMQVHQRQPSGPQVLQQPQSSAIASEARPIAYFQLRMNALTKMAAQRIKNTCMKRRRHATKCKTWGFDP